MAFCDVGAAGSCAGAPDSIVSIAAVGRAAVLSDSLVWPTVPLANAMVVYEPIKVKIAILAMIIMIGISICAQSSVAGHTLDADAGNEWSPHLNDFIARRTTGRSVSFPAFPFV